MNRLHYIQTDFIFRGHSSSFLIVITTWFMSILVCISVVLMCYTDVDEHFLKLVLLPIDHTVPKTWLRLPLNLLQPNSWICRFVFLPQQK